VVVRHGTRIPGAIQTTPKRRWPRSTLASARTGTLEVFADTFAPFEKATAKITEDLEVLLAFFDARTLGSSTHHNSDRFDLFDSASQNQGDPRCGLPQGRSPPWPTRFSTPPRARWRRINGHEVVPLVRAGATFIDGKLQERSDESVETQRRTKDPSPPDRQISRTTHDNDVGVTMIRLHRLTKVR
jgi:hypothetical protein